MDCPACGHSLIKWMEIKEAGKLDDFTTVMHGSAGFEILTPYRLAVVQFPIGIGMLGQIDKKYPLKKSI